MNLSYNKWEKYTPLSKTKYRYSISDDLVLDIMSADYRAYKKQIANAISKTVSGQCSACLLETVYLPNERAKSGVLLYIAPTNTQLNSENGFALFELETPTDEESLLLSGLHLISFMNASISKRKAV